MELYLKYEGILKSNANLKEKHRLRKHFHSQIKKFVEADEHLKAKQCWHLEDFLKREPNEMNTISKKGDFYFASLISSKLCLLFPCMLVP